MTGRKQSYQSFFYLGTLKTIQFLLISYYQMNAYRLFNTNEGHSAFQKGTVEDLLQLEAAYFFFQEDGPERKGFDWHPAPRPQYVITLRGKLEFTVTDGSTFIVEPGDVLIAQDVIGRGHKWKVLGEESWARIYIVLRDGEEDGFTSNNFV